MAVANALGEEFCLKAIVLEEKPSSARLLRRRVARVGLIQVVGQALFILLSRLMARRYQERLERIYRRYGLESTMFPSNATIYNVTSVNSDRARSLIEELRPEVIVINGTRILSREVLGCSKAPFINVHLGITPMYRGVHGGYWALANGDPDHCGATVHFVDSGIDTGSIIAQMTMRPEADDNFLTYPAHQLGVAMPHLLEAVGAAAAGQAVERKSEGDSRLYYHPTLWSYLKTWIQRGVR